MADKGDDRGSGFDDLFEDLDKFFAPEERADAGSGGRPGDAGQNKASAAGEGEGGGRGPAPDADSGSDAGSEDEILPADWLPDIDDLDLGEGVEPAEEPEAAPEPSPREQPAAPVPRLPDERAADRGTDRLLGPTAEMSQKDWSRLRHVLGDELGESEGQEVALPREPDVGPTTDMFASEEDEEPLFADEERHELTLEDLKKAPAEYRNLPRSEDGAVEAEAAQDDRDAVREDRGTFLGEREGVRDDFADVGERPLVPESTPGEETAASADEGWRRPAADRGEPWHDESIGTAEHWDEPAAEPGDRWGEPAIAEVEAAADQMAEEFRTELPAEDELLADIRRPAGPRTVKVGEPESLTGPAWEEPGSQVVTTEPAGVAFSGRNMPMALLTAAVLAVLALVSIAIDKAFFAFVVGGVVLIGQAEVYAAMQRKGYQPATALGLVLGGLLLAAAYLKGEQAMLFFVPLGVALSFLWYMVAAPKAREGALGNIGVTMLGLIYVPLLAAFLMIVLAQPVSGRALTLAILGITFLYDAAAFVIGSLWGSRALAPSISPKKSWEGLLAATFVTFIVSIAVLPSIDPLTLGRSVGLALVVAVFAPLGDLAESLLKRDLGVKDMGSVLPGHGGIMDRIDSALFVIPAAFYFLRLVF